MTASKRRPLLKAALEFLLIVVGVLVALVADDWRQDLNQRGEAANYLDRLVQDLRTDVSTFGFLAQFYRNKQSDLLRLAERESLDSPAALNEAARELYLGAVNSWQALILEPPTYSEMLSAGKLNLIEDQTLRGELVSYYIGRESARASIDARQSEIGLLSNQLLARRNTLEDEQDPATWEFDHEFVVPPDRATLMRIRMAAVAERNRAEYAAFRYERLGETATRLMERIRSQAPSTPTSP